MVDDNRWYFDPNTFDPFYHVYMIDNGLTEAARGFRTEGVKRII